MMNIPMNRRTKQIVDLFCATSDGTPEDLQRCIDRGCPWDKPIPGAPSRSTPINIAAQYQRPENLALLATKALEAGRPELLEAPRFRRNRDDRPLNPEGRSPAYLAVQKGNPVCLGVMAKAGANLHRAVPHTWQVFGSDDLVDPDDGECMPVHCALVETVMSFTTSMCMSCLKTKSEATKLKVCNQCKMAYFCSSECQTAKWPLHKKVCKKIKQGADLVTFHDAIPKPAQYDEAGFLPFDDVIDNDLELEEGEREEDWYDATKCWEYYDLRTQSWRAYPKKVNRSLEGMRDFGMSPRYMYKPGPMFDDAEGLEEGELSTDPPPDVATNHVYFCHMIDHHIYTGCGRRIRRRVVPAAAPSAGGGARRAAAASAARDDDSDGEIDEERYQEDRRRILEAVPALRSAMDYIDAGVEENEAFIRQINAARRERENREQDGGGPS